MGKFVLFPRNEQYVIKNERRYGLLPNSCDICGKPLSITDKTAFVAIKTMSIDGSGDEDYAVAPDTNSLFVPVGPECLRKHPELMQFVAKSKIEWKKGLGWTYAE